MKRTLFFVGSILFVMVVLASPAAAQVCVSPPSNLVHWWPLDEISGVTAADRVGGLNGTRFGSPVAVAGKVLNALRFATPGSPGSEGVSVPDDPSLRFGLDQDFTLDAWIKTEDLDSFAPILDKIQPTTAIADLNYGWTLFLDGGYLGFRWYSDNSPSSQTTMGVVSTEFFVADNDWHLVAVTVDRDQSPSGGVLYVDGIEVATFDPTTLNTTNAVDGNGVNPVTVAAWSCFCPPYFALQFDGDIDEVEVFHRALSQSELIGIFEADSAGKCFVEIPALSEWGVVVFGASLLTAMGVSLRRRRSSTVQGLP